MTQKELEARINASPKLRDLRDRLLGEVQFRADASVGLDPVTIIMIISIVVQVIIHCRENRNKDELVQDIQDIRALPARRLIRLRRRLNTLWRNCCADQQSYTGEYNPMLTAVYEIGENSDVATIRELIDLAHED
jgi:hypothetical protein